MNLKLQTRITVIYAIVFSLVLVAINASILIAVKFFNDNKAQSGLIKAEAIIERMINEKGSILNAEEINKGGITFPYIVRLKDNKTEVMSFPGEMRLEESNPVVFLKEGESWSSHPVKYISRDFVSTNGKKYNIVITKSTEQERYNRTVTTTVSMIASIIGIIFSIIVGNYMSHELLTPIVSMRKAVERIKPTNMHERIKIPEADDELKELGITFNSMLDRMDDAYSKQTKFVSDASHELRTPLTVIKGYVDMLSRWGKEDPEILDESIGAIKEETENMRVLVENLLFIARGENKKMKVNPEKFNLLEMAKEVAEETQMNNPMKNISYLGDSVEITADKKMIKQLMRIFIENSLKFTPENGCIKATIEDLGKDVAIKLYDNGDGISPIDLSRVFERFYIADKARTKDKSGSGLGLSIAKWIAEVHNGKISVGSKLGEYTEFKVIIPKEYSNKEA